MIIFRFGLFKKSNNCATRQCNNAQEVSTFFEATFVLWIIGASAVSVSKNTLCRRQPGPFGVGLPAPSRVARGLFTAYQLSRADNCRWGGIPIGRLNTQREKMGQIRFYFENAAHGGATNNATPAFSMVSLLKQLAPVFGKWTTAAGTEHLKWVQCVVTVLCALTLRASWHLATYTR